MQRQRQGTALLVGALLVGCSGPSGVAAKPRTPRGKPAHVRFANLTGGPVTAKIGSLYVIEDMPEGELSTVRPVSPGKPLKITATVGDKPLSYDLKTNPGEFATVVIAPGGMTAFSSGNSLSSQSGGSIDYVNLTKKPVTFKVEGASVDVQPSSSKTTDYAVGKVPVELKGTEGVTVDLGKAQIWAVYATEQKGVVTLKMVSLKGTGTAVGTGGPSAA
jgi:hypothetical protein